MVVFFMAVAAILGQGGAVMAAEVDAFRFVYRFSPGQALVYRISVGGRVDVATPVGTQTNPIDIQMEIRQQIREVGKDGRAIIDLHVAKARMIQDGQTASLPEEGTRSVLSMDTRGDTRFISGTGAFQGQEFSQMFFPDRPIRPGESWEQTGASQAGTAVTTRTRYTFSGWETVGGRRCAAFSAVMGLEAPGNNTHQPASQNRGKTWFDPELGQVVGTDVDSTFSFRMPFPEDPSIIIQSTTVLKTQMFLIKP
jgi:hypothetical protein